LTSASFCGKNVTPAMSPGSPLVAGFSVAQLSGSSELDLS
jgi:hypothetical protein